MNSLYISLQLICEILSLIFFALALYSDHKDWEISSIEWFLMAILFSVWAK